MRPDPRLVRDRHPSTDWGVCTAAGAIKDNQYECSYCGNFTRHADATDSDHTGITALHAAVQKEGHLDVVVALLEHGADVDVLTAKGNTPLMYAAAGGHTECAEVLLDYSANPSVRSEAASDTPLHKAVRCAVRVDKGRLGEVTRRSAGCI